MKHRLRDLRAYKYRHIIQTKENGIFSDTHSFDVAIDGRIELDRIKRTSPEAVVRLTERRSKNDLISDLSIDIPSEPTLRSDYGTLVARGLINKSVRIAAGGDLLSDAERAVIDNASSIMVYKTAGGTNVAKFCSGEMQCHLVIGEGAGKVLG